MKTPDTIVGIIGFMGVVALVLVLVSNKSQTASVVNALGGSYGYVIRSATGQGK